MMSDNLIKELSREQLNGKWLKLALMNLVVFAITGLLSYFLSILGSLLSIPVLIGSLSITFHVANSEELDFNKFIVTKGEYLKYLIYSVIIGLIQMAISIVGAMLMGGSLIPLLISGDNAVDSIATIFSGASVLVILVIAILMIVATVYVGLLYAMTPCIILMNREDIDGISALRASRTLIKGHKLDLFLFQLSFIGWGILSVISCGIGFLFLSSYYETALSNYFFELIKSEEERAKELGIIDNSIKGNYRVFRDENIVDVEEFTDVKPQSEEVKKDEPKVEEAKVDETEVKETEVEEAKVDETEVKETEVEEAKVDETNVTETNAEESKDGDEE